MDPFVFLMNFSNLSPSQSMLFFGRVLLLIPSTLYHNAAKFFIPFTGKLSQKSDTKGALFFLYSCRRTRIINISFHWFEACL